MRDSELGRLMSEAARKATDAAIAAGHGRGDKVTKDSARAAAEEVYRRERPEDWAPKPAPPVTLPETPPEDPRTARMEREHVASARGGDPGDDVPF